MINCLIIYVFRFNLLQNHCKNNEYYCEIPYLRPRNPRAVALNAMLILLDPAHGHNTPGKRSPDGILLEYACIIIVK